MMAEMDMDQFSLLSLEDKLTCSICLSPFDCPVTIPCGHNFCQDCLLATWKDSYSCPQCRTHFATKPELKKNTVLSTVVETFNLRTSKSEAGLIVEESKAERQDVIRCDTCMEAEASQTCLTCMASFCEEHLRPHRDNPTFRLHQLSEPVGDLSERICPDHHKMMELFCSQHGRPICSLCLQQIHKGCSFISPEEQRNLKEFDLREKLTLLDRKTEKTETVMLQMTETQSKLKDAATKRKTALAAAYQHMWDMLVQEERKAQHEVDHELEIGQTKLQDLMKRLTENTEKMTKAREDINNLLSQSKTLVFLQASFNLPQAVKCDPHMPRISLDSKKVIATQAFSAALKEHLSEILQQPVEARLPILKPALNTGIAAPEQKPPQATDDNMGNTNQAQSVESLSEFGAPAAESIEIPEVPKPPEERIQPRSHSPARPSTQMYFQTVSVPFHSFMGSPAGWIPPQYAQGKPPGSNQQPPFKPGKKTKPHNKPPSAPGGNKSSAKGSGSTKKDKPRSHPPSAKSAKPHPPSAKSAKPHPPSAKSTKPHPQPAKKK